ncbi:hypothetical protein [Jeotgalibacillus sp. R-1-5s-1]|uniref:hypothetical protein n=1 Tax=Jeotgalibacillus sp. R-1-5s-1 TaxID=2555897 RepID=UPI00141B8EE5|nr:hypothetical protein [Jeotgalibacillus sp. R-1-5s-1]
MIKTTILFLTVILLAGCSKPEPPEAAENIKPQTAETMHLAPAAPEMDHESGETSRR